MTTRVRKAPNTTSWTVAKRDGRREAFNPEKIVSAVKRCLTNSLTASPEAAQKGGEDIRDRVINIMGRDDQALWGVEDVQRLIVQQLFATEQFEAGEHYQNYREIRRRARAEARTVDPATAALIAADVAHFGSDLRYYQFLSKYARWNEEAGRRETWREACWRVIGFMRGQPQLAPVNESVWTELEQGLYDHEATCAMRVLQMAGPALERCNVGAYNCFGSEMKFVTRQGVKAFSDFKSGDTVEVVTHTGQWRKAVVRNYGRGQLRLVTIGRGSSKHCVRVTDDHRWLLRDGTWTTSLRVGDKLCKAPMPMAGLDYDAMEPGEKLAWCYGFVYGDGTRIMKNGEYRYSAVRLCGSDRKYLPRFEEMGFSHSLPPSFGGDIMVYTGSYLKTLPAVTEDVSHLRAFVRGWMDADATKNTSSSSCNEFTHMQVTGKDAVEFVRSVFPTVGVYINREEDLTGQVTNYGERSDVTVRFGVTTNAGNAHQSHFSVLDKTDATTEDDLWCLEVEKDQSFVLPNGIVTGNCAALDIDCLEAFAELLYILMQGSGVGVSVEGECVDQLPRIKKQKKGIVPRRFTVPDNTEGWCDSLLIGLRAWFAGEDVEYDYSQVRPAGAKLKTKGGRASGPEPLRQLLAFVKDKVLSCQGGRLTDIDCHDICCMIGKIVQVGGVRRASEISLSDLDSEAMRNAKSGDWWNRAPMRDMANNSAVYVEKPDAVTFMREWLALAESGSGERGIFNRWAIDKTIPKRRKRTRFIINPCGEIILRNGQFCNLSICVARANDTKETLKRKVRLAAIWGTLQSTLTKFGYIRDHWRKNCEEERLLGVDITGQMDCPLLRPGAPGRAALLKELLQVVLDTNAEFADMLGIPRTAAATCVKPSGNSAQFFQCSSGIHARYAEKQIRRFRAGLLDPLTKFLQDQGVPWAIDPMNESLVCFDFLPDPAPAGTPCRNDLTAIQQCEYWLETKENWAEHSVSCTVYVDKDEWLDVGYWVFKNFHLVNSMAFLPKDGGTYRLMPNEEVDSKTYDKLRESFPRIDWSKLSRYESDDFTGSAQELSCVGGACEM